jgi:glycosyltransferase involved in cell wall biosynthesis
MRIAYYGHVNNAARSGILHKMAGQIRCWRAAGHEVRLFLATRDGDDPWSDSAGDVMFGRYGGPMSRLAAITALVEGTRAFRPDVVYMRWDLFYPPMLRLPARTPLVLEVNTDDRREAALGGRARAWYLARTRSILLRRAAGLVFVTRELSERQDFRGFGATHRVISNGIDLIEYPVLPAVEGPGPRLVFVGTAGQVWHGIDKLLDLAAHRPQWRFSIVGMFRETALPNVEWHGERNRSEVIQLLAQADVGIGTLALHRKSMNEASPLKVREYLAMGLPVVYGYSDPDVDELGPWALRIDNTETNVIDSLTSIDAFVTRSRGIRIPRESIQAIDVSVKEEQRLKLFGELARS